MLSLYIDVKGKLTEITVFYLSKDQIRVVTTINCSALMTYLYPSGCITEALASLLPRAAFIHRECSPTSYTVFHIISALGAYKIICTAF